MIALLIGTVAAVIGAEWPRVSARFGSEARQRRERTQRKSQLKLLRTETEEFAASAERASGGSSERRRKSSPRASSETSTSSRRSKRQTGSASEPRTRPAASAC